MLSMISETPLNRKPNDRGNLGRKTEKFSFSFPNKIPNFTQKINKKQYLTSQFLICLM